MNTGEVGKKLVELCRKNAWMKAIDTLYDKDIVSVEARGMDGESPEKRGIAQVRGKTEWWLQNMEMHSVKVSGPFVAHDRFVVKYDIDVTGQGFEEADADGRSGNLHRQRREGFTRGISTSGRIEGLDSRIRFHKRSRG
jgi:hypothetical protein